ncbi:putative pyridoxal-dependent decarboxylase domain-containing protein 2 [Trichogramma pretiosum]|uniref:putative pyridoxal-dependent decarboxylase domain-containing protein 2 n=1 Tax=Trichogramma pretiosum TaxID=7493 RepID=UPI0006C9D1AB|nr:putative pyridoxal-dependent decarboxylase domain-containing protein 2 [Trichogramma pretiosum]
MQSAEAANTADAAAAPAVAAAACDNNTEMPIITSAVAAMEMHERNDSNSDSNEAPLDTVLSTLKQQTTESISKLEQSLEKGTETQGAAWNSSSGFLSHSKAPDDILKTVQDLMSYEEGPHTFDGKVEHNQPTGLSPMTDAARLSLISHSISALATSLPKSHAQRLAGRISADTTRWLSHIFRFVDGAVSFHEDPLEGLVRVTRLALHKKYPRYMDEGFGALASSPPLIYSSVSAPLLAAQYLCKQLSLPLHCIRPIPLNTMFGSRHTMDIAALEKKLAEDSQSNAVTPVLLLAEAGSVLTGHCDNIVRLKELCDKYNVWLHLRGDSLAALALNNSMKDLSTKIAHSITLPLGIWLGIPSLPCVTLYKLVDTKGARLSPRETTLCLVSGLVQDSLSRRLPVLPLWSALQVLGRDGIYNRFKRCFLAIEELYHKIKKFNCIRILSQEPGEGSGTFSMNELLTTAVTSAQLVQSVTSALVFQFVPPNIEDQRIPPYYDKLNSWLGQILERHVENIELEFCELEQYGIAIRISPLESTESPPSSDDIDDVIACLEQQIEILLATVQHKETFVKLVKENDSLHLVEMQGWAGLGGVRYAPPTWVHVMTDQAKEELNALNTQLVETLRSTDGAFSLGEGADGLACVRFGMVTQDTDVFELLSLVLQVGQEVEASSKLMDTMSEVVKRGIEAAQTDLERENAEKMWQEGILRHVPVVGNIVNWWSPPTKETGVRGRSLNLQAGVVESTENIYKYHMQMQANSVPSHGSGARTPPQPLVQTPVGGATQVVAGSQSHSRSSSHSSLQSGKSVPPSLLTQNSLLTRENPAETKS